MSEKNNQDEAPKLTRSLVDEAADKLKSLGPIPKEQQEVSKIDAIKLLRSQIKALQKKGYSMEQVAETLTECGIPITAATLSSYLNKTKKKTVSKTKQGSTAEVARDKIVPTSSPSSRPQHGQSQTRPSHHEQPSPRTGSHQAIDSGTDTEKPSNTTALPGTFQRKADIENI